MKASEEDLAWIDPGADPVTAARALLASRRRGRARHARRRRGARGHRGGNGRGSLARRSTWSTRSARAMRSWARSSPVGASRGLGRRTCAVSTRSSRRRRSPAASPRSRARAPAPTRRASTSSEPATARLSSLARRCHKRVTSSCERLPDAGRPPTVRSLPNERTRNGATSDRVDRQRYARPYTEAPAHFHRGPIRPRLYATTTVWFAATRRRNGVAPRCVRRGQTPRRRISVSVFSAVLGDLSDACPSTFLKTLLGFRRGGPREEGKA